VSWDFRPFTLQLTQPLVTARARIEERRGFEVRLRLEGSALVGRGEAAILPELGTETLEECEAALRSGQLEGTLAAAHAVEEAQLDLLAQQRGVPLCRLFEKGAPLEVPVSALLSSLNVEELSREAAAMAREGFGTVKLKVGQGSLEQDYARVRAVREAVGPRLLVRLDANGAWEPAAALAALRKLAPLQIEFCEQPVAPGRLIELRASPVRVAADESMATEPELALHCADVIVLKPMLLGGLKKALRWAARARELGKSVVVTTSLDGPIARAGAAHLAAAILAHGPQPAAGLATGRFFAGPDELAPQAGKIVLADRPGLGLA